MATVLAFPASQPRFDLAAFKRGFLLACEQRGIDPERGSNSYQAASIRAEQVKASHHERARQQVYAVAKAHPLNFDDGRGGLDWLRVEQMARRDWFGRDSRMWAQGHPPHPVIPDQIEMHGRVETPTEFVAIANVRMQAIAMELAREVERTENRVTKLDGLSPRRYYRMTRAA